MPGADRAAYFLRTQRRVRRPACVPTEDSFVDLNPLGGDGANRQDGCFDLRIQTNLRPLFPESTLSFGALAYRALGHTPPARDFPDGNLAPATQLFCANPIHHRGALTVDMLTSAFAVVIMKGCIPETNFGIDFGRKCPMGGPKTCRCTLRSRYPC